MSKPANTAYSCINRQSSLISLISPFDFFSLEIHFNVVLQLQKQVVSRESLVISSL